MADQIFLDNWGWYASSNPAAHAAKIAASMAGITGPNVRKRFLLKGGGDGGRVWDQWSVATLTPYMDAGIEPILWLYAHPDDAEIDAAIASLRKLWSDELVLNPEVEWGYSNGITDDYVLRFVDRLRSKIKAALGRAPEIGFSSVPSWTWFPYAAFSAACDGTEQPQCYFTPQVADQMGPGNRKSREGARVVVGLPACQAEDAGGQGRAWTDERLDELSLYYAQGMKGLVGFNGWQSGATGPGLRERSDFAYGAMANAYGLLRQFVTTPADVISSSIAAKGPLTGGSLDLPYNVRETGDVWHCLTPDGQVDTWVTLPQFLSTYQYYKADALSLFGLPISGMFPDERGRMIQYFERARFELENEQTVVLGRVAAELLDARKALAALQSQGAYMAAMAARAA